MKTDTPRGELMRDLRALVTAIRLHCSDGARDDLLDTPDCRVFKIPGVSEQLLSFRPRDLDGSDKCILGDRG